MSVHHQQKTLSAFFAALEGSENMIESDISNPINSCCWARTSDIRINSPAQLPTVLSRNKEPEGSERVTGIEPVTRAWKARMLPLHHTRI